MSQSNPSLFEDIAWERFLRLVVVIAFVTATFVFTAAEILPASLSTIAVGAFGSVAMVTAIIGFLIGAASTLEHAEERAEESATRKAASSAEKADVDADREGFGAADGGPDETTER